ncbi:MAG: hypothetical protein Q9217_004371 [Psora testacea]
MSRRASVGLSTLAQIQAATDCLFFLYRTKTICSPTTRKASSPGAYRHRRIFLKHFSHGPYNLGSRIARSYIDIPFVNDPIGGTGSDSFQSARNDAREPKSRSSTLTASERAIFDRITKDQEEDKVRKEEERQESLEPKSASADDPYEDLNKIFDAAIRAIHNKEEQQVKSMERDRHSFSTDLFQRALDSPSRKERPGRTHQESVRLEKSFARPLQFTEGKLVQPPIGDAEESSERLRIACQEHRALIEDMLDNTSIDTEIWDILETEVFSMVKQLDLQLKQEENFTKVTQKARAKVSREPSRLEPPTEASKQAFASLITSESKALTINTLLAILRSNYAHYNLFALRLWRRRHPSTPYSLQLLPHIKSLGSISYVLGASASLYNEIFFVKWDKYFDLHGIAELLQEMINRGVPANSVTLELLRYLDRTRYKDLLGGRGKSIREWWKLRSVKEDWSRLREMYIYFKLELRAGAAETAEVEPQSIFYPEEKKGLKIHRVGYDVEAKAREKRATQRESKSPVRIRWVSRA